MKTGSNPCTNKSTPAGRKLEEDVRTEMARAERAKRREENKRKWRERNNPVASHTPPSLPNANAEKLRALVLGKKKPAAPGGCPIPKDLAALVGRIRDFVDAAREGDGTFGAEELRGISEVEWIRRTFGGLPFGDACLAARAIDGMLAGVESDPGEKVIVEGVKSAGLTWARFEVMRGRCSSLARVCRIIGEARRKFVMECLEEELFDRAINDDDNGFSFKVLASGHERFKREAEGGADEVTTIVVEEPSVSKVPPDPTGGEGIFVWRGTGGAE